MKSARSLLSSALVAAIGVSCVAVTDSATSAKLPAIQVQKRADNFKPIEVKTKGTFSASLDAAKNATYLNSTIPDSVALFRLDGKLRVEVNGRSDEEKLRRIKDYIPYKLALSLRLKSVAGDIGSDVVTTSDPVKLVSSYVGSHSHKLSKAGVWFDEFWGSFNSREFLSRKWMPEFTVKVGMFPYLVGRGISLGAVYGRNPSAVAVFSEKTAYYAAGILIRKNFGKDAFFDFYYSKQKEKSSSVKMTLFTPRDYVLDRGPGDENDKPWAGKDIDTDLLVARSKFNVGIKQVRGKLEAEPYAVYLRTNDAKIEVDGDSKSRLLTVGAAFEYKSNGGKLEFGGEVARNFGYERAFAIDRNTARLEYVRYAGEVIPALREVWSHLYYASGPNAGRKVPAGKDTQGVAVATRSGRKNGAVMSVDGVFYKNADDRFRGTYKNTYAGWMLTVDGTYRIDDQFSVSAVYAYTSGAPNPQASDSDERYKAFIPLQEYYYGKRVKSILMKLGRSIQRPMEAVNGSTSDKNFSGIQYVGMSMSYHAAASRFGTNVSVGTLAYWRTYDINAYDRLSGSVVPNKYASRYLGSEVNLVVSAKPTTRFSVDALVGLFVPGRFYNDIAGMPMKDDVAKAYSAPVLENFALEEYRIGTSPAVMARLTVAYSF